jgi:hypothetical protein
MKKIIAFFAFLFFNSYAFADVGTSSVPYGAVNQSPYGIVTFKNIPMGTGQPSDKTFGSTIGMYWGNGLFFVPGYLPGYPTAAVLWDRVIDVNCKKVVGGLSCDGSALHDQQVANRGEYILYRPVIQNPPVKVIEKPIEKTIIIKDNSCSCKPLPLVTKKIRE